MPTTTAPVTDNLGEDAGQLALAHEDVVRPLHPSVDVADPAYGIGDGEAGEQRQPAPPGSRHLDGTQQHREGQPGAGRRGPRAIEPPAAGGLRLRDQDEALRLAVRARAATSAFVEPVESTTRISRHTPPGSTTARRSAAGRRGGRSRSLHTGAGPHAG
jgi:hypothetical protein